MHMSAALNTSADKLKCSICAAVFTWEYDHELYKRRNEVERLFRRIKAYRRVFTRYDKLDIVFLAFVSLALIIETLH